MHLGFDEAAAVIAAPLLPDGTAQSLNRVERFIAGVDAPALPSSINHYCLGLMLPVDRKSVEPLAAVTAPARVSAKHQSLLHFVGQAPWSDEALLARVRDLVLPAIERHGPVEAWIVDDTGFPKKGRHSVGVARQYCGQLGKQDNCICWRSGPTTLSGGGRRRSRTESRSRPSLPSRWTRSAPPKQPGFRPAWCWPTPAMARTAHSARASRRSLSNMSWACCPSGAR